MIEKPRIEVSWEGFVRHSVRVLREELASGRSKKAERINKYLVEQQEWLASELCRLGVAIDLVNRIGVREDGISREDQELWAKVREPSLWEEDPANVPYPD